MEFIELIDELLEYIENTANLPLSSKCIIDRIEVAELIKEIKKKIPEDLNKAKWVLKERERILSEAEKEAQNMINNSGKKLMSLIDEHEITKSAKSKANETIQEMMVKKAEINSSIREYASGILKDLEKNLESCLGKIKENIHEIEKNKR